MAICPSFASQQRIDVGGKCASNRISTTLPRTETTTPEFECGRVPLSLCVYGAIDIG